MRIRTRCEPRRPTAALAAVAAELDADLLLLELSDRRSPSAITPRVVRALTRKAPCEVVLVGDGPVITTTVAVPGTSTATA